MRRFALVLVLQLPIAAQASSGPSIDIEVERRGRVALVTLNADDALVRDVFVQLGAKLRMKHRLHPGAPETMEGQRIPVSVHRMPAADLVAHLAGAAGLEGAIVEDVIDVRPLPDPESDAAMEWSRTKAIDAWLKSSLTASEGTSSDVLYRTGLLHLAGEEWSEAISDLERFAVVAKTDGRAPRALLLAADAALRAGDLPLHESLLDRITIEYTAIDEVMHAHLRKARVLIDREDYAAALPLIERVESDASDHRLRALASLFRAELWFDRGDGNKAMEVLASFDIDRQRAYPDLAESVPLYEGLSLILADSHERALPRLQLCLLSERPELRVRGALALAKTCLAIDQRFAAYQNVRIALNQNPTGRLLVEAHLLEAEILVQLGLTHRALEAYERVARSLPADAPDGLHVHLLEGTARLLYRRREFEGAIEIWRALAHRRGREAEARLQIARCLIEQGQHAAAITELEKIPPDAKGVDFDVIAAMRGNCYIELKEYAKAAMAFGSSRKSSANTDENKEDGR